MTAASVVDPASIAELSETVEIRVRREVRHGLTAQPKTLPPWLLYDAAGSRLFEDITELPEYYLTRTEKDIFAAHACDIVRCAANDRRLEIFELGAGSAAKTGLLLEAAVRRQKNVTYHAVDVSETALKMAKTRLEAEFPEVKVEPRIEDYTVSLNGIGAHSGARGRGEELPRKLVLSIGSSIGNFHPEEAAALLGRVREQLAVDDGLLLGIDMVKDPDVLLAAYNDSAGVTARFNKNLLTRINRELGGNFEISRFCHKAVWNPSRSRIEMHLRSIGAQEVLIDTLGIRACFASGESIHTENSYKFTRAGILHLLDRAGFSTSRIWTDKHGWFAVQLATAV